MRNARRTRWAKPAAGIALVGTLAVLPALTGCAGVETASAAESHLTTFGSCAALTQYARTNAAAMVGPYGLGGGVFTLEDGAQAKTGTAAVPSVTASEADATATRGGAGVDFSTTNVQEAGVDEPDIVKSDGKRVFAIAKNRIYAVDTSGATPRVAGSLGLPDNMFARDMLLVGDTLVVLGDGPSQVRPAATTGDASQTSAKIAAPGTLIAGGGSVFLKLDVSDPTAMTVRQTFETEARYVTARLNGTTARVVVTAGGPMGVAFTYPTEPGAAQEADAARANRNALTHTTADNWIPRYQVTTGGTTTAPRPVVPCNAVSRPPTFSGLETLTVLTMDLNGGLEPIDSDSVMASGENVYASTQSLYVATNRWAVPDAQGKVEEVNSTQVHKFEISSSSQTSYRGSGSVVGHTLNQFSMSEYEGNLRIATTEDNFSLVGGDAVVDNGGVSESHVTVLDEQGDKLVTLGQVGGLGKGERIYAVRFIGPTGYVVTFKQTDPLYTVDLSNPSEPRVAGELKIAGYSAYLHPVDDHTLIGVGQDATDEGRTTGLQISLFDVSDPAAPKRIQTAVMPGANSDAEWDHHAFLWWPATNLAVVPFQRFFSVPRPIAPASSSTEPAVGTEIAPAPAPDIAPGYEAGALGLTVGRDGITELGRVNHPNDPQFFGGVRRSLVVGDQLLTISDNGLKASALSDLTERAWLPFS
jgi:Beta propeller domain